MDNRYVKRQRDGSYYLSGLVLADAIGDPRMAQGVVTDLLNVVMNGVVLPTMVAIQFAPTPYDLNCSPYSCQHPTDSLEPTGPGKVEGKEWEDWGSIRCTVCRSHLGWWCPKSPDHHCHYNTDSMNEFHQFVVELSDGREHIFDEHPHDDEWESEDSCLFCGSPEERK